MDSTAVYHDLNPKLKWLVRTLVPSAILLCLISAITLLVQALHGDNKNESGVRFLTLAVLLVTFSYSFFIFMWYLRADLDVSFWWFVSLVALVLMYQSIVGLIISFRKYSSEGTATTTATPVTITPFTIHPRAAAQ